MRYNAISIFYHTPKYKGVHPAADSCFGYVKFLASDDILKVQVQLQTLALEFKRQKILQSQTIVEQMATPQPKKSTRSLLDTLLGSHSEEHISNEEDIGQGNDSDTEIVRNEVLLYFGDNLSVPATSTPSEHLFSTTGNIVAKKRASLTADHVDMLTFPHDNV